MQHVSVVEEVSIKTMSEEDFQDSHHLKQETDRGTIVKRKDYFASDKDARSHPNRTYFF